LRKSGSDQSWWKHRDFDVLQKLTIRLDSATAAAVAACAHAERKKPTDIMREGVRLRLEAGAMVEPVRVALNETAAALLAHMTGLIVELKAELIAHIAEVEARERETTRRDISDFLAGLNDVVHAGDSKSDAPTKLHERITK
jgi:hypothetical protein